MTLAGLMRSLSSPRVLHSAHLRPTVVLSVRQPSAAPKCDPRVCVCSCRCFAQVQGVDRLSRELYFTSSLPRQSVANEDHRPPDERTLQLGKTVRTLHDRLPTLLQSPLPSDILSPEITLHLFPSTHPHLPTVTGRIAYLAALWTAPVAWGRMPLIGNVKLVILSERMVRHGGNGNLAGNGEEKLIVKWKTCGKTKARDGTGGVYRGSGVSGKDPVDRIKGFIAGTTPSGESKQEEEEFTGLFIFEFDGKGRIVKHTIEHTDEGGRWDQMTRVVSVTDWLLGNLSGKRKTEQAPELAWCEERPKSWNSKMFDPHTHR